MLLFPVGKGQGGRGKRTQGGMGERKRVLIEKELWEWGPGAR